MGLPERIKTRRLELGLDQLDLAQKLGIRQSSICDWEKGKTRPRRQRLPELAKALRVATRTLTQWWMA